MAYHVIIDAGHGGRDPGAVYNGRQEKDDVLELAMAVGEYLEQNGVEVSYTRTTDVYQSPYEKAQIGNRSGADLFLSLHRNASAAPGTSSGIETLVYDQTGNKVAIAEAINSNLQNLGFNNRGIISRPGLVVLRRTNFPALLVEAGFIDNEEDNARFDENFDEIAAAIAGGILSSLPVVAPAGNTYRIQVGAFRVKELATTLQNRLLQEGYPAYVNYTNGLYKVQVGSFQTMEEAVAMEQELRQNGYSTFLIS